MTLSGWRGSGHAKTRYDPGPVASDTTLSPITGSKPDPIAFELTKTKTAKAIKCLENDEMQEEDIANIIEGTTEEFSSFMERQIQKGHA
jgi:hypothetical protein